MQNRQLAAIFFADIAGYTSLMQKDETAARQALQKFRQTIDEQVAYHKGKVVNFYGDGCLCTFDSSVNAMNCAKAAQMVFQSAPRVPVRIGLHSGDVVFEDDNAYGDSVNITSRIESLGLPGSILFSKRMRRDNRNQANMEAVSLGSFSFKNVEKEMEVFALAEPGFVVPGIEDLKGKGKVTENKKPLFRKYSWLGIIGILLMGAFYVFSTRTAPHTSYRLGQLYELNGEDNKAIAKCNLLIKSYQDCDAKYRPWVEAEARRKRLMDKQL